MRSWRISPAAVRRELQRLTLRFQSGGHVKVVGAVVIVGSHEKAGAEKDISPSNTSFGSFACVELLGRTVLGRTIEELLRAGVDSIAVVASGPFTSAVVGDEKVGFSTAQDPWQEAAEKVANFKAETVLVVRLGAYVEFEAADLLQFHRDQRKGLTRAWTEAGSLELWAIDPAILHTNKEPLSVLYGQTENRYFASGYVNWLESPRDVRQLVVDGLAGRCHFRPQAAECKPGVWVAQGVEIERTARLVAPVYLGRHSKIADQCLITRGSNVESHSQIDYGTAIEDSTVLSNTYVGIGLDLSHSIVQGNNLLHVEHGVRLKISDPVVLRPVRENRIRAGVDGTFLANLEVHNVAMSSMPKTGQ